MAIKHHWITQIFWLSFAFCLMQNSWAGDVQQARALIQETTDKMLVALNREKGGLKSNPKKVFDLVDEIVLPHFDFESMSKLVLAKNWRTLDETQQERFVKEFRTLLVRTYATALVDVAVDEVEVEYEPVRAEADARRLTVKTHVAYGEAVPMDVDYGMLLKKDEWKVYNVSVGGVSLVTNYRSEFGEKMRTMGADGLTDEIAARNRQAEAGQE